MWPNGWMDEDATWYGSKPRPMPHCVRRGPSSPQKKHSSPPPLFDRCLLPRSLISVTAELLFTTRVPDLEKSPLCLYICWTKNSGTFSFDTRLYLCGSVEFVSNRKMTVQYHYQYNFVVGDVTWRNLVSFWWHRQTYIYRTTSITYLSSGIRQSTRLGTRVTNYTDTDP